MPEPSKQEINLFYCYAHEDKALRDELEKHLNSLKRIYALRNWHDREILPGDEWEQVIDTHLNTAHLILLLVSPDFMNSDYCYGKEMQRALERHEEGSCRVIPIILRPTYLEAVPFHTLLMLPTDAKPITRWKDRDEAFHDVVRKISLVLKDLLVSLKTKKDWLDEGISLRNSKSYEYALEVFEQALRLDPNYLEAYQEKGMTFLELERYEEALTTFEQAHRLDPNLVSTYIGRDKALQHLGISREAQEQLAGQLQQTQQQLINQQKRSEQLESGLAQIQQQKDEAQEELGIAKNAQKELASQLEKTRQKLETLQKRSEQLEIELGEVHQRLTVQQGEKGQVTTITEQAILEKHIICMVALPFRDSESFAYKTVLLPALREVLEQEPYYWQVASADEKFFEDTIDQNVAASMDRARAYIVDISNMHPHVMMELGYMLWARKPGRPVIVLERSGTDRHLADLAGVIRIFYPAASGRYPIDEIAKVLKTEFAKHEGIQKLNSAKEAHYLSPLLLRDSFGVKEVVGETLSNGYTTMENFVAVDEEDILRRVPGPSRYLASAVQKAVAELLTDLFKRQRANR